MGELSYVSIGVGYTLPFSLAAAPWIDAHKLSERLNDIGIPGIEFRPIYYKPFYGQFKNENVAGVQVYIRDAANAPLSIIQFYVMQELASGIPVLENVMLRCHPSIGITVRSTDTPAPKRPSLFRYSASSPGVSPYI